MFLILRGHSNFCRLNPCFAVILLSINIPVVPLSKSTFIVTSLWVPTFSIPIVNQTSLRGFNVLLTSLSPPSSLAVPFGASVHALSCYAFLSLGYATFFLLFFLRHPHHLISFHLFLLRTPCSLFSSMYDPFFSYHSHSRYVTTISPIYHSSSIRYTLSGISSPQCSYALHCRIYAGLLLHTSSFCYAFCGFAMCAAFSSFFLCFSTLIFGHFYLKCPTPQHLKHLISSSTFFHLTLTSSFTLHLITLLANTSNLFWGIDFPSPSFLLFLQLWARCLNFLQL